MTPERHRQIEALFHQALDVEPDDRAAFLRESCGGDPALLEEVESLLGAHDEADRFIEVSPSSRILEAVEKDAITSLVGRRVGSYELVRVIATGGMGTVYEAVQQQPRRTVALKLMRTGIASRASLRRFQYESQILARLRHPGIAQVYEAGMHREGRINVPYFAMEYVPDAKTIIDYAEAGALNPEARLELFAGVCDAVHYGHQRGIIHRDLKPANVLVDPTGQPKVIDFGVARVTDTDVAVTTMQTDIGQLIGTLQYMSPEQCDADPQGLDTRSDVYSLGAVLYELLCGRVPYDVAQTTISQATRIIRETQPRRFSTAGALVGGDIETITLKALEKDRDRRYPSAAELGQDIRRFLAREPIQARAPSVAYQLRMFAVRNKALVGAFAAVMFTLVCAVVVSALFAAHAKTERDAAVAAREAEVTQRATAERTNAFLQHMLASANPKTTGTTELTVREVLDQAALRVDSELADQPEVAAAIHDTIGNTYFAIGRYDEAENHMRAGWKIARRLNGDTHPDTASSLNSLAYLLGAKGEFAEAEKLLTGALVVYRQRLGAGHRQVADALAQLALVMREKQDFAAAIRFEREALAIRRKVLGSEHAEVIDGVRNLGEWCASDGQLDEAEARYREALTLQRKVLGGEHRDVAWTLVGLGVVLLKTGDLPRAEQTLNEAHAMQRKVLGDEHLERTITLSWIAAVKKSRGAHAEAEKLYHQGLEIKRRTLGAEHVQVAHSLNNLGAFYAEVGKLDQAEAMYRQAWQMRRNVRGDNHPETGDSLRRLASVLTDLQRDKEAEPLYLRFLALQERLFGKDSEAARAALKPLIRLHEAEGSEDRAAAYRARLNPSRAATPQSGPSRGAGCPGRAEP